MRFSFRTVVAMLAGGGILSSPCLFAQELFCAWSVPTNAVGNYRAASGYGIGEDFRVLKPIIVSSLGVFDDRADGVQGQATLVVHLYASNPDRARKNSSGVPLETLVFDAANPGVLRNGFRYKSLQRPVMLIPGQYTVTAEGFDDLNLVFKEARPGIDSSKPGAKVSLGDGGGLVAFEGGTQFHVGRFLKRTRTAKDLDGEEHRPDKYAAVSFGYSQAPEATSRFAGDFSTLTAGVQSFPVDGTNKPTSYDAHYGSLSVLCSNAFPVITEPSGDRLVLEAAGENGAARCVAFAHSQWGQALGDARRTLFMNAVAWAVRNQEPEGVLVGVTTNLSVELFRSQGYGVAQINPDGTLSNGEPLTNCDVVAVDISSACSTELFDKLGDYVANGGNVVATCSPWQIQRVGSNTVLKEINAAIQPFGLAYRSSLVQPADLQFTNVQSRLFFPKLFSAFDAAELLGQDRQGKVQLDSLQRAIARNTLVYASDGDGILLSRLAALATGSKNTAISALTGGLGNFMDASVLYGVQANPNMLGSWCGEGTDLLSEQSRGCVEYDLDLPSDNIYRIQVFGSESPAQTNTDLNPDLLLALDSVSLGQYDFLEPYGAGVLNGLVGAQVAASGSEGLQTVSDHVEALTPFLRAGTHKLRIFWNNRDAWRCFRIQSIHIQSAVGEDSNQDGLVDWVQGLVEAESGLDSTNATLTSIISPACIEGRDVFPGLIETHVAGGAKPASDLLIKPAPNDRWYANVPLAADGNVSLSVSYQNGAKTDARSIRWLPVNILDGGTITVRDGDSLLLTAHPGANTLQTVGAAQVSVGTNQFTVKGGSSKPWLFAGAGTQTVRASYTSPDGTVSTGVLTVNVIHQAYTPSPDCHVGEERLWSVNLPVGTALEADQRLVLGQLDDDGSRVPLTIDQSQPRAILARLGTNGPVLNSWTVQGFDFWEGGDTYLRVVDVYPDGTQLLEMLLILNPVPADLKLQVDILVGGVVFEDGTVSKQLGRGDFDALGQCKVRFLHSVTSESAVCHSVQLLEDGTVVGRVW